jgi:hypothetical protein
VPYYAGFREKASEKSAGKSAAKIAGGIQVTEIKFFEIKIIPFFVNFSSQIFQFQALVNWRQNEAGLQCRIHWFTIEFVQFVQIKNEHFLEQPRNGLYPSFQTSFLGVSRNGQRK